MKKKYYLEAVRILAILMVMYNHSAAFMSFSDQSGVEYAVSFLFSMVCKGAVPLFFMVSGALLLGKNESGKDLFKKRILRIILVIVLFSFLYYLKLVLKGERPFAPFSFLLSLPSDLVYLPYWFLYSYLGVLTILPILRPLAQNMSKNTFWYLIILQILLDSLKPTAWILWGYGLCGYYNFSGLFQYVIFYPLIGYGLDQYFSEKKFVTPQNIARNLFVIVAAVLTQKMVYKDYLSVGNYQEVYLGTWLSVPVIVLFLNAKLMFQEERLSECAKKVLSCVGSCVFGCYLLGGFIGTGGRLDIIANTLTPVTGMLPAYIIEIVIAFGIQVAVTMVLKRVPVFRKLL